MGINESGPRNGKTDEELLLSARSGEQQDLFHLIKRYEKELYSFICRSVEDRELAEEIFKMMWSQEFLNSSEEIVDGSIRITLYRIAIKIIKLHEPLILKFADKKLEFTENVSNFDLSQHCLDLLPPDDRILLLLTVRNIHRSKIAEILGDTEPNITLRIMRATEEFQAHTSRLGLTG